MRVEPGADVRRAREVAEPIRQGDDMEADARRIDRAGLVIAIGLLALAGVVVLGREHARRSPRSMASDRRRCRSWSRAGSRCSPSAISSWRCAAICRRAKAPIPKPILLILGGLAALIALIGLGGGFIPATAILFATTSAAFGRRAFLTDLAHRRSCSASSSSCCSPSSSR